MYPQQLSNNESNRHAARLELRDDLANPQLQNLEARQMRAKRLPNAKLSPEVVRMIRESRQSHRALARLIGVSHEAIRQCRVRITWGDVK